MINKISNLEGLSDVFRLNLENNQIEKIENLDDLVSSVGSFEKILVGGNPLSNPPEKVVKKGYKSVLNYFSEN